MAWIGKGELSGKFVGESPTASRGDGRLGGKTSLGGFEETFFLLRKGVCLKFEKKQELFGSYTPGLLEVL